MKKIAVVGSMDLEVKAVEELLSNPTETTFSGFRATLGSLDSLEVAVLTCGIGKVNAALSAQSMIDAFQPEAILLTGIAGSLTTQAPVLSAAVASRLTYHDISPSQLASTYPFQAWFPVSEHLMRLLLSAVPKGVPATNGPFVTGDRFITSAQDRINLTQAYSALCVDMESTSIAHAAYLSSIPFAAVKCISDMADDNAGNTYDQYAVTAAERAAKIVSSVLPALR